MTMNKEKAIDYVSSNKGFCYMTSFVGKVKPSFISGCESCTVAGFTQSI